MQGHLSFCVAAIQYVSSLQADHQIIWVGPQSTQSPPNCNPTNSLLSGWLNSGQTNPRKTFKFLILDKNQGDDYQI